VKGTSIVHHVMHEHGERIEGPENRVHVREQLAKVYAGPTLPSINVRKRKTKLHQLARARGTRRLSSIQTKTARLDLDVRTMGQADDQDTNGPGPHVQWRGKKDGGLPAARGGGVCF
jgi:hypothetical protein